MDTRTSRRASKGFTSEIKSMAEPFVFRFAPGAHGAPEVMYVADVRCECGLCRHTQMQRFYHSTPLHPLTLAHLGKLVAEVPQKADYECENCGEHVGPAQVCDAVLTYGFPDDTGVIRAYVSIPHRRHEAQLAERAAEAPKVEYELISRRRLDPQELPGGEPSVVKKRLDEGVVERILGRAFSPKLLWVELFEDWQEDPDGGAYACAAPGYWFFIDQTEDLAGELAESIDDPDFCAASNAGDLMVIPLLDSLPATLATHRYPEDMPGHWREWMSASVRQALEDGQAWAEAHVSRSGVVEIMRRTFELARLTYQIDETAVDVFFSEITTPGEEVYGRGVAVSSVLRRAVYTGITPQESGRLTAEEIVGMLLRVWEPS